MGASGMVESRIDKRSFIESHRFTVLVFIALAGGRLLYIAACATPLEVDLSHLRYAAPALAIGTYYTFVRYRVVVAAVFNGLGLAAFSLTGNVMSSVLTVYTGRGFPLADEALNAADRLIGFDWIALLKLVDSYPFIDAILQAAY